MAEAAFTADEIVPEATCTTDKVVAETDSTADQVVIEAASTTDEVVAEAASTNDQVVAEAVSKADEVVVLTMLTFCCSSQKMSFTEKHFTLYWTLLADSKLTLDPNSLIDFRTDFLRMCRCMTASLGLSLAGVLAAALCLGPVARASPRTSRALGLALSFAATAAFTVNVVVATFPGSPGSEPSSVYWVSLACLALSFYLCVCHVEICLAGAAAPAKRREGEGEYVPLVPPGPSASGWSTCSRTTATPSDDEESTVDDGSATKLMLVLRPEQDEASALTFDAPMKPPATAGKFRYSRSNSRP